MYEPFFGLTHAPFSVAPDPRFIYMSPKHRVAVKHLVYGLRRGGGFLVLTGEVGAGKTTVWRSLLKRLPSNFDIAYVVNPRLKADTLLTRVCEDLRVELPPGDVDLIDALHGHLLLAAAQGRRTLIVVDEAQALSVQVLEQLRLLTNLDTTGRKLQVLLIGQPELASMLRQPELEPLAQRVVARFHLPVLPEEETTRYVAHRLWVAGLPSHSPFDDHALRLVHKLSRGVPRRINVLCDRAMFLAYSGNEMRVHGDHVERAAIESFGDMTEPSSPAVPQPHEPEAAGLSRHWRTAAAVVGVMLTASVLLGLTQWRSTGSRAAPTPPTLAPAVIAPTAAAHAAVSVAAPQSGTAVQDSSGSAGVLVATAWVDEASAWRNLSMLWKVALDQGDACQAAERAGLHCFRSTGGLTLIRQLDRPALLKLADDRGHEFYVLLLGLGKDSAMVQGSGGRQIIPLTELERQWRGDFSTLWRSPAQQGQDAVNLMLLSRTSGVDEPRLQLDR